MGLEEIALSDDYFISRKLYPNVDFYTGLIYKAMGFYRVDVHAAVRARSDARLDRPVARDDADPQTKIGRPRQIYTGATERDYVGVDAR